MRLWAISDVKGFSARYARACELRAERWAEEIVTIADDGTGDEWVDEQGVKHTNNDKVQRSRLRVDTRKWLLSKLLPRLRRSARIISDVLQSDERRATSNEKLRTRLYRVLLLSASVLVGCDGREPSVAAGEAVAQPESAVWTDQTAWRLSAQPVVQINGSNEIVEEAPLDPVSVFKLPDGRYVVADGNQNGWDALLVYNQRGKFIEHWGREGRGPGEFGQQLVWAGLYRGDSIAAYDWVDRALEIFTLAGKHARSLKLPIFRSERPPRGTFLNTDFFVGAMRDGSVLRFEPAFLNLDPGPGPVWYEPDLQLYDANGLNPRRLASLRTWANWWDGKAAHEHPFKPYAITTAGSNVWYHGTAEDFAIGVFDSTGREVRRLNRTFQREEVTPADREALIRFRVEQAKSGFEGGPAVAARTEQRLRTTARFADYKPAFTSMIEDAAGNLWVEHYRWVYPHELGPDPKPTRWSVFDAAGRFLGEVQVPASFIVSSITNDQVLGFWQDEFDVQHVRVYALIRPAK